MCDLLCCVVLSIVGEVRSIRGEHQMGEKTLTDALNIQRQFLKENHPETALSKNCLQMSEHTVQCLAVCPCSSASCRIAECLILQQKYCEAEERFYSAELMQRQSLGMINHPDRGRSHQSLCLGLSHPSTCLLHV